MNLSNSYLYIMNEASMQAYSYNFAASQDNGGLKISVNVGSSHREQPRCNVGDGGSIGAVVTRRSNDHNALELCMESSDGNWIGQVIWCKSSIQADGDRDDVNAVMHCVVHSLQHGGARATVGGAGLVRGYPTAWLASFGRPTRKASVTGSDHVCSCHRWGRVGPMTVGISCWRSSGWFVISCSDQLSALSDKVFIKNFSFTLFPFLHCNNNKLLRWQRNKINCFGFKLSIHIKCIFLKS